MATQLTLREVLDKCDTKGNLISLPLYRITSKSEKPGE